MKRFLSLAFACLIAACAPGFAQEGSSSIQFNWVGDGALIVGGAGVALAATWLEGQTSSDLSNVNIATLNALDALAAFPNNETVSNVSSVLLGLQFALPAVAAFTLNKSDYIPALAVYAEALSWTAAAKDLLKYLIPRARPYAYSMSAAEMDSGLLGDADESFPSGHTAYAFCAATVLTCLELRYGQGQAATPYIVGGAYALATSVAVLRVCAGKHFITDTLAGAALGSGIGLLVTELHLRRPKVDSAQTPSLSLGDHGGSPALSLVYSY
jgi:membrane-associated phospholipid phosphatase